MSENNSSLKYKFSTPLLGLLTLIVTLLALIPAFLSLNDKEASIYYSVKHFNVSITSALDTNLALSALEDAGIPGSTIELTLINQGNKEAESVRIEIQVPDEILAIWSEPSEESMPIWVTIPKLSFTPGNKIIQETIENLATTKPLRILIGYKYAAYKSTITVFSAGRPATRVEDINTVPKWSKWRVFLLPIYIFLGGIGLIIAWGLIVALSQNPSFRNSLVNALIDATHVGYAPISVINLIAEALNKERKKNDNPDKNANLGALFH